mmetsp:Transcript_60/g.137  ORF Transcript_60/g.137 Transcript_60/m.137 type:complete len:255 (+) Transcript_60:82-846(+)
MRITPVPVLFLAPATPSLFVAASEEQCYGFTPMPSVSTYLGATLQYSTAERICCENHVYAEFRGYLAAPEVDFFGRLDPTVETVFYDSVCGIPLFIAPRGRSFAEFQEESLNHGWPSFRPEELVSENVIIHDDGRMESICLTHLGHNLPDDRDRYCIDLVCMAGEPLSPDDERVKILSQIHESAIHSDNFNVSTYTSSAEDFSGKFTKFPTKFVVGAVAVVLALFIYYVSIRPRLEKRNAGQWKEVDSANTGLD